MITLNPLNIQRWTDDDHRARSREMADCRASARQTLRARAALLARHDRLILELICLDMMPVRRAAELLQLDPGTVSRRARVLLRRVMSRYVSVVLDAGDALTDLERTIAVRAHVSRTSASALAKSLGLSAFEVHRRRATVIGWYRGKTGQLPS